MIELKLTFSSFAELADFADHNAEEQHLPPAKVAAKAAPAKAPKKAVKPEPEPEAEDEVEEEAEAETEDDEGEELPADPTFDDVREAIMQVNKLKGKNAAKAVLDKFGVAKVGPALKESQWAKFIAACEDALND